MVRTTAFDSVSVSSILAPSTNKFASVAQSVERNPEKVCVGGASPSSGTKYVRRQFNG